MRTREEMNHNKAISQVRATLEWLFGAIRLIDIFILSYYGRLV